MLPITPQTFSEHCDKLLEQTALERVNKANETLKELVFPVEAFPPDVQDIINELNIRLNFPVDYIASGILFSVALAAGNHIKLKVKNGWIENAVIFIANVGNPNTNKSHPLSFMLSPLFEYDKQAYDAYLKEKRRWENDVDKKDMDKPHWKKCLVSDFTPEALSYMHMHNKKGIGVYVDELAGWFKNFNRYHKGAEQEFWLSAWSGKTIQIDRKSSEPIFIPDPFIPVIGTIQNRILNELARDNRGENGFIDRILFAFPAENAKPYFAETEITENMKLTWACAIDNIKSIAEKNQGLLCRINEEGRVIFREWLNKNTDECNELIGDSLSATYGKFDVHLIRLILILHILNLAGGGGKEEGIEVITAPTVKNATLMANYFKRTALHVNEIIIQAYNPIKEMPENYQNLYEALPAEFDTATALDIAKRCEVPRSNVYRFFKKRELFSNKKAGKYTKLII